MSTRAGSAKGFAEVPRGRKVGEARDVAEPKWIVSFLEALGVTGNVGASAEIAGVDVTGVYRRKTRNAEFRAAWSAVLRAREARARGDDVAQVPSPSDPTSSSGPLPLPHSGEGLVARATSSGVMMARAGKRRWSAKAEAQFLAAIANGADVTHAAAAAGVCKATVMRQRAKDARFAAVWLDAMAAGQAVVQAGLISQAARDADEAGGADAAGRMTVAERMAVAKLSLGNGTSAAAGLVGAGGPYAWSVAGSPQAMEAMRRGTRDAEEVRIRIMEKLHRTRLQLVEARRKQGGLEVGRLVLNPGWVWQGEGPIPPLPGQYDDQGWDGLGPRIEEWRKRRDRGEEVPFQS